MYRSKNNEQSLRLGVIGAIGDHKGYGVVNEMLERIRSEKLPVSVVVVGYDKKHHTEYVSPDGVFTVTGPYDRKDLCMLMRKHDVDLALIPSILPETFCYTAVEAMICGYPIITFDLGAQAEHIRATGAGIIIEEISVHALIACLKDLLENPNRLSDAWANLKNFRGVSKEEYERKLLSLFFGQFQADPSNVQSLDNP